MTVVTLEKNETSYGSCLPLLISSKLYSKFETDRVMCRTRTKKLSEVHCQGPFTRSVLEDSILLVPKIGTSEHIENDFPTNGSVILKKKRMEIEHALFSSDTLLF